MELFDTHFVWFGQVLLVSGMKLLVTSNRYIGEVTTIPRLVLEHLFQNENKHQIMNVHTKWNLFDTHFVWFGQVLPVSGMKLLVRSNRYVQVVKSLPYLDYFWNTYSKMKTNIRL